VLNPDGGQRECVGGGGDAAAAVHQEFIAQVDPAPTRRCDSPKTMRFTGTSVLKVVDGLIVEEIGLDDGVTVLQQLDLIKPA
jgi:hypothetical protein